MHWPVMGEMLQAMQPPKQRRGALTGGVLLWPAATPFVLPAQDRSVQIEVKANCQD